MFNIQALEFRMLGIKDETRQKAQDILRILTIDEDHEPKISRFSSMFPCVDAHEVCPGIFIGNK